MDALTRIVDFSLRHRLAVLVAAILLVISGVISLSRLPVLRCRRSLR